MNTKLYEIYTILKPQLNEEQVNSFATELEQKLGEKEISVDNREIKLGQRLSYPIKHQQTGNMVRIEVSATADKDIGAIVDEQIGANEDILRRLTITRPPKATRPDKQTSVIDQLRRKERKPSGTQEPSTLTPIGVVEQPQTIQPKPTEQLTPQEAPNIEEIDKKIEELLT